MPACRHLPVRQAGARAHSPAYDVQYLAVARMHDCPIITVDHGMAAVAATMNIQARLLT